MDVRGHLDLILLATLHQVGPAHGYALIVALRERSGGAFELAEGTVYPVLHKLERDGLVASAWSSDATRRRRVYELTPTGAAALVQKRSEWMRLVEGVATVLKGGRHGLATRRWGWSTA
jgi:DNA-binding PadR family transcriptional regulator